MRIICLVLLILVIAISMGCTGNPAESTDIHHREIAKIKASEKLEMGDIYLLLVSHPDCLLCPAYRTDLVNEYLTQNNSLKIYEINIAEKDNSYIWSKYELYGTPVVLLVKNGAVKEKYYHEEPILLPVKEE